MLRYFKKPYQTLNQIEISKGALSHNFRYFQNQASNSLIAPVLKSNAYGHGLVLTATWIDNVIKPPFICVDSLFEAYELTKAKIKTPILILGYTDPQNFRIWRRLPFTFPVFDAQTAQALNRHQPGAKIHLKIDTGMNRLGLLPNDVAQFITILKKCPNLKVEGIYSHLSQADSKKGQAFTQRQINTFINVITQFETQGFRFKWRHISATSGTQAIKHEEFNLIRLGLGFYGYSPYETNSPFHQELVDHLKPALRFTTQLIQIKRVGEGSEVGYGGTYKASKNTVLGILPVGYADGVNRRLSNKGIFYANDKEVSVVGRVCMNLTIIKLPKGEWSRGDLVEIIGTNRHKQNSLYRLAELCDTIPYTQLVNLNPTIKRVLVI